MRVLVATDSWPGAGVGDGLDSLAVGSALARTWAALGDEVAVIPVGAAGQGFGRCLEQLAGALDPGTPPPQSLRPDLAPPGSDPWTDSSEQLAEYLRMAMPPVRARGRRPVLEIAGAPWRDGGRGMAVALGLTDGAAVGAGPAVPLTLVTTAEQAERQLTGLRGLVSTDGRAEGMDPARMLRLDQQLCDWAQRLTGRPDAGTEPGSGAVGGLGLVISALGGEITTGTRFLLGLVDAVTTVAGADLVVTGCQHLDMMSLEGDVVSTVTALAGQVGVPVIAVTRTSSVSARELRQSGLEAAMPLGPPDADPVGAAELTRRSVPVARTWHW